jgi:hypothetical protein
VEQINVVDRSGWECATHLLYEHFSAMTERPPVPAPVDRTPQAPMIGPFQPSHRTPPTKRVVGPIEEGWINFQPHFKADVVQHELPTIDTIAPEDPFEAYLERAGSIAAARDEQYAHLSATQCCRYHANGGTDVRHRGVVRELETVADELARAGISSFSLSSSPPNASDDDELEAGNVDGSIIPEVERDSARLNFVPYDPPDPALVRRIEWEKYISACGPATRFMLVEKDGQTTIIATRDRVAQGTVLPIEGKDAPAPEELVSAARKIAKATSGQSITDFLAARERAAFYGGIGSLLYGITKTKGFQPMVTADFADIAPEDFEDDDEYVGGPKELGLADDEAVSPLLTEEQLLNEPPEERLWPLSVRDIALTLTRGLRLAKVEEDWLEANPDALGELMDLGLGSYL